MCKLSCVCKVGENRLSRNLSDVSPELASLLRPNTLVFKTVALLPA